MEKFITKSEISKKILKIAQMSSQLPVNIFISGQTGVGRKILAREILHTAAEFEAKELEALVIEHKINLQEYKTIILFNFNKVLNKLELLEKLDGIKVVATGFNEDDKYLDKFAVKIDIPPLEDRPEDLDELIKIYSKEANRIYASKSNVKNIKLDLSGNGRTLKQSIFKSILLQSIGKQEMMDTLQDFFVREFENERSYKELIEIFEIPLLKAAKIVFKSQLQIANKLNINRITLRKKLNKYFGE